MFARVNFVSGSDGQVEEGIEYFEGTVLPTLEQQDGFRGAALFGGRTGGGIIATFWESEQALEASAEAVVALREEALRRVGATGVEIAEYEVPVFHRKEKPQRGAAARLIRVSGAADQVDAGIAAFRDSVVPSLEQLGGFRTAVLFADRSAGRLVAMTVWADENAQSASEAAAAPLRSEVADRFGASVEPPALYELLITTVRP